MRELPPLTEGPYTSRPSATRSRSRIRAVAPACAAPIDCGTSASVAGENAGPAERIATAGLVLDAPVAVPMRRIGTVAIVRAVNG